VQDISIRYGEVVTLPLDAADATAVSASLYIGKPGEVYTLTKTIALSAGVGTFVLTAVDTRIPIDTYYYQINITDETGAVEKFPSPKPNCEDCEIDFPKFIVCEALDEIEVS